MSRGEYDRIEYGMTRIQVLNLADIYGNYLGDSADQGEYRVGYNICWTNDRRAVLGYSYNSNRLEWWDIRDK